MPMAMKINAAALFRRLGWLVAVVGLIGLGLWLRWPLLQAADCLDSDASIPLLMARHFARGEWSWFFWGQIYMGSLEPLVLTPLVWLGWDSMSGACYLAMTLFLVQALLATWLCHRLGGTAWLTALVMAIPSSGVAIYETRLYGARLISTSLGLLAVLLLVSGAEPVSRRRLRWAGALLGLAVFGDPLMLLWAIAVGIWIYLRRQRPAMWTLASTLSPWLVAYGLLLVACHDDRLARLGAFLGTYFRNLRHLVTGILPVLGGADYTSGMLAAPATPGWQLASVAMGGVTVMLLWGLWRQRARSEVRLLGLICGLSLVTFPLRGGDLMALRYLLPILPAMAILAGVAVRGLAPPTLSASHTSVLLGCVLVTPALYSTARTKLGATGVEAGERCRAEAAEVAAVMKQHGARALWADYWDAYRLAALLREPFPVAPLAGTERRPDWTAAAKQVRPAGYLLRPDSQHAGVEHQKLRLELLAKGAHLHRFSDAATNALLGAKAELLIW